MYKLPFHLKLKNVFRSLKKTFLSVKMVVSIAELIIHALPTQCLLFAADVAHDINGDDAAAAAEAVDADASEEVVVGRIEEVVSDDMLMFNFVAAAEKLVVWLPDNDDEGKVQNAIMYAVEQRANGGILSGWSMMMPFLCD